MRGSPMDIEQLFAAADTCRPVKACPVNLIWTEYRCPHCPDEGPLDEQFFRPGTRVVNDDGLPTCVTCGRSDWDFVSDEPEWNGGANEDGDDPSRVGAPVNTTLFSAAWGSGTIMSVQSTSTYANKRLARINFHTSMNHKDRALHHAYENLDLV